MAHGAFEVAKNYVTYRYTALWSAAPTPPTRRSSPLIESLQTEAKQENASRTRW